MVVVAICNVWLRIGDVYPVFKWENLDSPSSNGHDDTTCPITLTRDFGCRTSKNVEICICSCCYHIQYCAGQVMILLIFIPLLL